MATGPQGQKRPGDVVGCAVNVAQIAVGEIEETQTAEQIIARSGGRARAGKLSPERRKEIAQKAAMGRWSREKST